MHCVQYDTAKGKIAASYQNFEFLVRAHKHILGTMSSISAGFEKKFCLRISKVFSRIVAQRCHSDLCLLFVTIEA